MKTKFFTFFLLLCIAFPLHAYALDYPEIKAEAALVVDPESGLYLYEKNAGKKMYPASTTKIMTALLTLEYGKLDEETAVSSNAVKGLYEQGSAVHLKADEVLTLGQLLHLLMIASGNDAANVIAEHIAGDIPTFVEQMNARARQLGCTGTNFINPHGLHDENHYTTAEDLYKIALEAMTHPLFREICLIQQYDLPPTNLSSEARKFYSTNNLISPYRTRDYLYDKAIGIKTGSTTPAGNCLVAAAAGESQTYYSVVLNAPRDEESQEIMSFIETELLLEWAFRSYSIKTLISESEPIEEVEVNLAQDRDFVVLVPQFSIAELVPNDIGPADFERTVKIDEDLRAPIEKGDILGEITLSLNDKTYGTIPLIASNAVERSSMLYALDRIGAFFSGTVFKVIVALVLSFIVLLGVYIVMLRRSKNRRSRGYHRRGGGKK